ncbi:hypothetical protein E8E14_005973 [Neopestalotiopsis sp. 37M]|nr:hypothetical protein E8E14_005973 [Neopestalotiopsis sp. 37M]
MKILEYPPELQSQRLLRKGKGTFAVGCGPLPDDTDWSEVPHKVLKEECSVREMPTGGAAQMLKDALTNYKAPESLPPAEDVSNIVGKGKSADGEKRKKKWQDGPDYTYYKKLDDVKNDPICLISLRENGEEHKFGGPSIEFKVANGKSNNEEYRVNICKMPTSVLVNILKVPEPFSWQNAFLSDELGQFFEPIMQASSNEKFYGFNASHLADGSCPICFQEMTGPGRPLVECPVCHANIHERCFHVWAMNTDGYGDLECMVCLNKWTEPGEWGLEGLLADDRAIQEAKAAEKAAAKALKAAEKAAEKAAKASKKRKSTD